VELTRAWPAAVRRTASPVAPAGSAGPLRRGSAPRGLISGRDAAWLAAAAKETGAQPLTCDAADPRQVTRLAREIDSDLDVLVDMAGGNTDFTAPAQPGNGAAPSP